MSRADLIGTAMLAVAILGLVAMLAAALRGRSRAVVVVGLVACGLIAAGAYAMPSEHVHGGLSGHPRSSGVRTVVTTHETDAATVIRDPWCAQSEDSCVVNFRPSGEWALRRVTP